MAKAILGGLLSGAGRGMVDQAEQKRQDALERARELRRQQEREQDRSWRQEDIQEDRQFQSQRDELQHSRTVEREEASDRRNRGLLTTTVTGEDGNLYGITREGSAVDTGVRPAPTASRSGSGGGGADLEGSGITMSAEEKRLYDELKDRYTNRNTQTIDWDGFISHLRNMPQERGAARWNEIADHLTGGVGTNMTEEEARTRAAREAQGRMGLFTSRSGEFPETGGDVERWTQNRVQELMGGGNNRQTQVQSSQSGGGQPPGAGTREDPYKATTQEQIDWFRNNAPSGTVIEVNGTLYTK